MTWADFKEEYNTRSFGVILGLTLDIVGILITKYFFAANVPWRSFYNTVSDASFNSDIITSVITVAVFPNAIVFGLLFFMWGMDTAATGIVFAVLLLVGLGFMI